MFLSSELDLLLYTYILYKLHSRKKVKKSDQIFVTYLFDKKLTAYNNSYFTYIDAISEITTALNTLYLLRLKIIFTQTFIKYTSK